MPEISTQTGITLLTPWSSDGIKNIDWSKLPFTQIFPLFNPKIFASMSRALLAEQVYIFPATVASILFVGFPTAYREKYLGIMVSKILEKLHGEPLARVHSKKTRLTSLFNATIGRFIPPQKEAIQPIFNKEITEQIEEFIQEIKSAKKTNGFLQNMILHGEPGTGKTMVAERIAKSCGLDYVFITGGDIKKFGYGEGNAKFNALLDSLEHQSNPTIVFIDEAQTLLKSQNSNPQLGQAEFSNPILSSFLTRTGDLSRKVMFILATNHLDKIDPPVRSRMSRDIYIPLPDTNERIQIIEASQKRLIEDSKERELFLSPEQILNIAQSSKWCSGRDLIQIVNLIYSAKITSPEKTISDKTIATIMDRKVNQARATLFESLKERGLFQESKEATSQQT